MAIDKPAFSEYPSLLTKLKDRVAQAQGRAALAVNAELVRLYWEVGQTINERQKEAGWGAKVVDRLSRDLRDSFPAMKGFSARNLKYMQYFAKECPDGKIGQLAVAQIGDTSAAEIGQPAVAQLTWVNIITILTSITDHKQREWYAAEASREGWSRTVLKLNIRDKLHLRRGKAVTNFSERLPQNQALLSLQALKDPYLFDFLGLGNEAHEREIETALVGHITRFLLELGAGFAFVGRQVRLEVAGDEFFIDLLFYHIRLKCYMVVELKATDFKPDHAGQLNFYISAVDAQIKDAGDNPTIGLLLCKHQNRLVAEYALADLHKPIGVAEYRLVRSLPEELETVLPSIEDIEAELSDLPSNLAEDSTPDC